MKFPLRLLVFTCVAALCLTNGCQDNSSQAPEDVKINLFNPKRSNVPKQDVPRPENERERLFFQGLREASDVEAKRTGILQALWHSTLFLAVIAAAMTGLYYWHTWRKKRAEWEVNDPMALVKELNFVHQLSEPEKRVMQELAKKNALTSPLKLFVEPKYLLSAWDDDSWNSSRSSVRLLLSRLFDIAAETGEATAFSDSNSNASVSSSGVRKEGK